MSFDLYFAGTQNKLCHQYLMEHNLCRLQSQLNDRPYISEWVSKKPHGKLFIDSGAYTSYTKGISLDVDEYIDYVNSIDEELTIYAQVDKIPGTYGIPKTLEEIAEAPALSWENYLYMRNRVISPNKLLPIFHRRESWCYLEQMLETTFNGEHIPYIGIAATTDSSVKEKEDWFYKVFQVIKKSSNPMVKTHAFGMTSLRLLEKFPFTSADSTSWIMVGANGGVMSPFGVVKISENFANDRTCILNHCPQSLENFKKYLRSIEMSDDISILAKDYRYRILCNIKYLENWCKNYVYKGSIPTRSRSLF